LVISKKEGKIILACIIHTVSNKFLGRSEEMIFFRFCVKNKETLILKFSKLIKMGNFDLKKVSKIT
jgi:hypothetical protein